MFTLGVVFLDLPAGVMNVYILTYCYKSDSKDFYIVSKDLCFKETVFF